MMDIFYAVALSSSRSSEPISAHKRMERLEKATLRTARKAATATRGTREG